MRVQFESASVQAASVISIWKIRISFSDPHFIFIQRKPSTSIGGEMNAICDFGTFSVGVQTPTEIEKLSLRTPRPVATTEPANVTGFQRNELC